MPFDQTALPAGHSVALRIRSGNLFVGAEGAALCEAPGTPVFAS